MVDLRLAGRRLWVGIPGARLETETRRLLEEIRPGGVVLFRRNITSLDQVRGLIRELTAAAGPGLLISIDQEGGLVVRFHRELTVFPGNMALGAAAVREPSLGEHLAEEQGFHSGRELRDLGIQVNLAPVLDLARRGGNPGCGIRSFGENAELVTRLGAAAVKGLHRGGVHSCLKHFPGLGEATVDSHLDLPVIEAVDETGELRPFQGGIEAGACLVMTSHVVYRRFDGKKPATLSKEVTQGLLRQRLGFAGAVMTDDLEMGAMTRHFGFDATVRGASAAGHDILCVCHTPDLQRRAHALLVEGLTRGEEWFLDPVAVTRHLDTLDPLPDAGAPDRGRAAEVAEAIAGRAITVVRDDRSLLPLRPGLSTVLALPTLRGETMVEDPLRGEEDVRDLMESLGPEVELHSLPTEPAPDDVLGLLLRAQRADRLLVVLTNGRFLEAQTQLARRCVAEHPGTVLLPIRNPFDLEVIPRGMPYTAVVSYGFRPLQLRALARVLRGEHESYGRLPIILRAPPP